VSAEEGVFALETPFAIQESRAHNQAMESDGEAQAYSRRRKD
jgi:hypothetical protein